MLFKLRLSFFFFGGAPPCDVRCRQFSYCVAPSVRDSLAVWRGRRERERERGKVVHDGVEQEQSGFKREEEEHNMAVKTTGFRLTLKVIS